MDAIIREISFEEYQARTSAWDKTFPYSPDSVVAVKELAFGCLGETSSKVSLWFDLPEPTTLTNQEIKRHKRNKHRKLLETPARDTSSRLSPFPGMKDAVGIKDSSQTLFENHCNKPFFHMQPYGNDSSVFHLIQLILKHRIAILLQRKYGDAVDTGKFLTVEEVELKAMFQNVKKDVEIWKWPVTKGRERIGAETTVPSCNANYEPSKESVVSCLWKGLVKSTSPQSLDNPERGSNEEKKCRRLPVFKELSKGKSIQGMGGQRLTHIKTYSDKSKDEANEVWKTIIGDNSGGWNLIKDHYLGAHETLVNKDKNMPLSAAIG